MSVIGLEGALRTCKVDTGWASRIQSDRFENPNLMVCPVWNGRDLAGRPACADSFYTKRAGCNSALDRVDVENAQRPQYMEYINLDAAGIYADIYKDNMFFQDSGDNYQMLQNVDKITGSFGYVPNGGNVISNCAMYQQKQGPPLTGYQEAQGQIQHPSQHPSGTPSGRGMGGPQGATARATRTATRSGGRGGTPAGPPQGMGGRGGPTGPRRVMGGRGGSTRTPAGPRQGTGAGRGPTRQGPRGATGQGPLGAAVQGQGPLGAAGRPPRAGFNGQRRS